ncbi:sugar phosphate isomerase/epimerase family protein [Paenibacillus humicola]|uniref:sugar phosphate isomerase/epimerase family protein n=1 Tax=Paenibacillus humicola TaxID=3110540 RepID=UPI00237B01B1|nr:sugar phosphate isomerase/epimerase family protein [Paenibacillus humicola]
MSGVQFSVFTKPWKDTSTSELAKFVKKSGFDGIEFPLRPGYQVEPKHADKELPVLVKQLNDYGLKIFSVASSLDERVFAACAEAGIPIIRTMIAVKDDGFIPAVRRAQQEFDEKIAWCEKYGITIGVQNHNGRFISNSSGLLYLLEKYDPKHVTAIWDAAHNALEGEEPEIGLSAVWSHLAMVNFKNAYQRRTNGPESEEARWEPYFTTGRQGYASWRRIAGYLKSRDYQGVVCLTAEYSDEHNVNKYIKEDIEYARSLF